MADRDQPAPRALRTLGTFTVPPVPAEGRVPYGPPEAPPAPPLAFLAPWLEGAVDLVRGGLFGATGAGDTTAAKVAEVLGAALPLAPLKSLGFFSRVDKALDLIPAKGAHPNKVASLLKSNASAEELAYRNVPEFLAGKGNATVTRADLAAHLAAHPAPVPVVKTRTAEELVGKDLKAWLGTRGVPATPQEWTATSDELTRIAQQWQRNGDRRQADRYFRLSNQATELAEGLDLGRGLGADAPKYAQYQLPGGEAYRETLVTLPTPKGPDDFELQSALTQAHEDVNAFRRAHPDAEFGYGPDSVEYRRLIMARNRLDGQLTAAENAQAATQFRSGHFDEPNILVHTRANERTLPTGERGRFVEEVQSDWHQKGKQHGYLGEFDRAKAESMGFNVYQAESSKGKQAYFLEGPYKNVPSFGHDTEAEAWDALLDYLKKNEAQHGQAVPDAPFKETWPDLGLKQQVLETAADPNAEWIGFTGGGTQAARYDLSKQISRVEYSPKSGPRLGSVRAYDLDGNRVLEKFAEPGELPDIIGKEATEKLLAVGPRESGSGRGVHILEGLDLQVGGEGMRHFYDQVLPKRLEKIVKPFGGTVERGTLGGRTKAQIDAEIDALHLNPPPGDAYGLEVNRLQTLRNAAPDDAAMWFARLTPAMKARILKEGLPLLSLLPLGVLGNYGQQPQEPAR